MEKTLITNDEWNGKTVIVYEWRSDGLKFEHPETGTRWYDIPDGYEFK